MRCVFHILAILGSLFLFDAGLRLSTCLRNLMDRELHGCRHLDCAAERGFAMGYSPTENPPRPPLSSPRPRALVAVELIDAYQISAVSIPCSVARLVSASTVFGPSQPSMSDRRRSNLKGSRFGDSESWRFRPSYSGGIWRNSNIGFRDTAWEIAQPFECAGRTP